MTTDARGREAGEAEDREALVDHLRRNPQASLTELQDAARARRGEADPEAVRQLVEAMEEEGALILRGHLYALAPWLRDGAPPPDPAGGQPKKGSAAA
jgi:hypothetical protein